MGFLGTVENFHDFVMCYICACTESKFKFELFPLKMRLNENLFADSSNQQILNWCNLLQPLFNVYRFLRVPI